ncbi:MAG TPA: multiheme c-type cytochrome [Planctomycetota bacterium]|nr:multiheme c-type cytochrome [Planctomycetota bacterium]HRR79311.1 multiheme c-type cytochrome [Planctomycetota bacterium]HRT97476.1 multiheme c-type cytochrome [Planctomycetota bacterium]
MGKVKSRKKRRLRFLRIAIGVFVILAGTAGIVALLWSLLGRSGSGTAGGAGGYRPVVRPGQAIRVSFFLSCDIQGRLAPYKCEEGELGGVARMATLYSRWTKEAPQRILVDAGNSTIVRHDAAESVNAFTFSALDRLGYDVVNCGEHEAAQSLDELRMLSRDRKFKLISANLVRADSGAPIFPTHHIVQRAGLRIAFIGVLREDILPLHTGKGVRLKNPAAELGSVLSSVKSEADVIVVLAYLPPEEIYELARKHPEVHLFLGGASPVTSAVCEVAGPRASPGSLVCYLGDQGCTVARLDGAFAIGATPTIRGRIAILDHTVPPDPDLLGPISEFTSALSGKPVPGSNQDPKMPCTSSFVGSDVCKLCHIKEFYAWQATAHAGAYVTLLQKGSHKDPDCLACHATGHQMPGGFDPDRPAEPEEPEKAKDAKEAKGKDKELPAPPKVVRQDTLKGVGCESCHGGSRRHLGIALKDRLAAHRTPLLRPKPSVENCIRCHTTTRPCIPAGGSDTYERNEYMDRIKHWGD